MIGSAIPPLRRLETSTATLAYREWGSPEGQPLVFWHALGPATSGAYLAEIAPILAARHGLRIVAPDAPGFGASPALAPTRYEIDPIVDLFAGLLGALHLDRPIVMGHSWGGVLAAFLAARLDTATTGLILIDSGHMDYQDTPGFAPDQSYEAHLAVARQPERNLEPQAWDGLVDELRQESRRWSPAIPAIVRAGVRVKNGLVTQVPTPEVSAAVRHALGGRRVSETYPALASSGTPVLAVIATEPPEAAELNRQAAERFREAVPNAAVVALANAGHDLFLDAGPALGDAISAWLTHTGIAAAR